ncbi:MAG: DNA polymerase III subunit alpha, partial [Spirochaetales bacterium]|nr:DNA polymerase III subunit alpha [Spirochaetales bacterium]
AWEKDAAEDAGLVKIDILGNRSLGVLRDSITMVNRINGNNISWEGFCPLDNRQTREQIEQGDTLGIFYVESPATRQLLKKMGTGDYEHLVIASSIIRPAANSYINEFVRRLRGGSYTALHPTVAETLSETFGIMVYQEDVSRIAIALCGFTPAEADTLRKILSKKDRECRMGPVKELFYLKGRKRRVAEEVLDELWEGILSFTGYSFCKAHSASYALVSYKLAWMKRFYPLQFMVSVINNGGGFYSRQVYLNAVRRMGFTVLGPDINRSEYLYSIEDNKMRIGFSQLNEVSRTVIEKILLERNEQGPFSTVYDFYRRVSLHHPDVRVLVRSGCLDSIAGSYNRPQLFWLFFHRSDNCYLFDLDPVPPLLRDYAKPVKVLDEISTTGLVFSRHPVAIFRPRALRYCAANGIQLADSTMIADLEGQEVSLLAMIVTEKEVLTKKKDVMSFVSFEDEHTLIETVLFPGAYSALLAQLDRGYVFIVQGKVEKQFGVAQINVSGLVPLNRIIKD